MAQDKKKTALQKLEADIKNHPAWKRHSETLDDVMRLIRHYKPVEREQHIETYRAGTRQFANEARIENPLTPQDYFTNTYGNE